MSDLSLTELLDSVGINKSILAKLMDVSRSTVMRMGEAVSDDVLSTIDKYKADMTSDQSEHVPVATKPARQVMQDKTADVLPVTHENIARSRVWQGREYMVIDKVADKFGLSVFDYNQAVQDTINHCVETGTSFKALRGE